MIPITTKRRNPPWLSTAVVIILMMLTAIQCSDTTSGEIRFDDMTINWRIEIIEDGPRIAPGRTSIAVDPSNGIHVTYHDAATDGLGYAYRPTGGNWTIEVIDSPGMGNQSEIGVDSKGAVHIAYEDRVGGALKYAVKQPGGDWSIRVFDLGPRVGGRLAMVIDARDGLSIAYLDRSTPAIRMATLDEGGEWNISSIVVGGHAFWGELDLAIGENGSAHLVYQADVLDSHLLQCYYAYRWPGEEWRAEELPCRTGGESHLSIALDENGDPYVVVDHYSKIFSKQYGDWRDAASYLIDYAFSSYGDIRFDSRGCWLVCGRANYDKDLRYYQLTPVEKLRTGIVDDRTGTGLNASMAVGPDDRFHIVYYDEAGGELKYATDADRPSEPVGLKATGREKDILLEWGMPTHLGNATSVKFDIYRNNPFDYSISYYLFREGWTSTSFADIDVNIGQLYYYFVVAVNGAGEGDFSHPVSARPQLHPTKPQNMTATAGPDNVVLSWDPPLDTGMYTVTGYRIYWWTGTYLKYDRYGNPMWSGNVTVDDSARSFNHTGLVHGTNYHYGIAAIHATGEGEMSSIDSAIPMVLPGPPTTLIAYRGDGRIVLNWLRPIDDGGCRLTAYRVYRGTSPTDLQVLTTIEGKSRSWWLPSYEPSMTLVDNGTVPNELGWGQDKGQDYLTPKDAYDTPGGLEDGVTYYYQVSAVQLMGDGPRSSVLEVPPERTPDDTDGPWAFMGPFIFVAIIFLCMVLVDVARRKMAGRRQRGD